MTKNKLALFLIIVILVLISGCVENCDIDFGDMSKEDIELLANFICKSAELNTDSLICNSTNGAINFNECKPK